MCTSRFHLSQLLSTFMTMISGITSIVMMLNFGAVIIQANLLLLKYFSG